MQLGVPTPVCPVYNIDRNRLRQLGSNVLREQPINFRLEFDVAEASEIFVKNPQWTCPHATVADCMRPAQLLYDLYMSQKPYVRAQVMEKVQRPRRVTRRLVGIG